MSFCNNCGNALTAQQKFCSQCGHVNAQFAAAKVASIDLEEERFRLKKQIVERELAQLDQEKQRIEQEAADLLTQLSKEKDVLDKIREQYILQIEQPQTALVDKNIPQQTKLLIEPISVVAKETYHTNMMDDVQLVKHTNYDKISSPLVPKIENIAWVTTETNTQQGIQSVGTMQVEAPFVTLSTQLASPINPANLFAIIKFATIIGLLGYWAYLYVEYIKPIAS